MTHSDGSILISSPSNPRIRDALALRDRRHRNRTGMTRIEGYEELRFACESGVTVAAAFLCPELMQPDHDLTLIEVMRAAGADVVETTRQVFERVAYREGADGWLAIAPVPDRSLVGLSLPSSALILVAEAIEKPGNLGAMVRTAEAAGVDLVIAADPVTDWGNPNVIRASKGAVFGIPVASASTEATIAWLAERGVQVVVTTPAAEQTHVDVVLGGPIAIVVGAEDRGVGPGWINASNVHVRIPMVGRTDSLNASVAAAVLIYEAIRQRRSSLEP